VSSLYKSHYFFGNPWLVDTCPASEISSMCLRCNRSS